MSTVAIDMTKCIDAPIKEEEEVDLGIFCDDYGADTALSVRDEMLPVGAANHIEYILGMESVAVDVDKVRPINANEFLCDHCGYVAQRKDRIRAHVLIHITDRPLVCTL